MMSRILALLASCSMLACALVSEDDSATSEAPATVDSGPAYYSVRPDLRKCAFPACGGYWVARANSGTTVCANGKKASECYVPTIDWSGAGLTQDDVNAANPIQLFVRGSVGASSFNATEGWASPEVDLASGTYYRVTNDGALTATKLNSTTTRTFSSFSGTYGPQAAASQPVIVAGSFSGSALSVSQFWRPIRHIESPLACTVDSDCTVTAYGKPVNDSMYCYCASCPDTVLNVKSASANESSWKTFCSEEPPTCPAVSCAAPPAVACVSGSCQAL